jgi:hypothetical protein
MKMMTRVSSAVVSVSSKGTVLSTGTRPGA